MVVSDFLIDAKNKVVDFRISLGHERRKINQAIRGEMKQTIVLRKDLKLSKGKSAAQASHASVSSFLECKKIEPKMAERWLQQGQKKVVLAARNEAHLKSLKKKADAAGLASVLIQDAGRTEIKAGTVTAIAIGPAPEVDIDSITGSLPLY